MGYSTNSSAVKARERYHNDPIFRGIILRRNSEWMKKAREKGWEKTWDVLHPKEHSLIQFRYRQKLKLIVITHYGGNPPKCAYCGISDMDVLTIDHINNDGANQRRKIGGGYSVYRWIIRNNFPKDFGVLCFNCNWKKQVEKERERMKIGL